MSHPTDYRSRTRYTQDKSCTHTRIDDISKSQCQCKDCKQIFWRVAGEIDHMRGIEQWNRAMKTATSARKFALTGEGRCVICNTRLM